MISKMKTFKTIIVLMPLVLLMPLAMDIYVPAIPELIVKMAATPSSLQATLSIFMVVFALAQLVVGPFSDQIGRFKTALIGAVVFMLACFAATMTTHVPSLLLCRVFQAIGACFTFVAAFATVRDCYSGEDSGTIFSYLNGMIAFSPIFGPAIGSFLDLTFGWQAEFMFLAILGIVASLIVITWLKESLLIQDRVMMDKSIGQRYWRVLKNKNFLFCSISCGIGIAYLFTFFSLSPYILLTLLHKSEKVFGYYFAFMGVSFMLGSFLGAKSIRRYGSEKTIFIGHMVAVLGGVMLIVWYHFFGLSASGFVIPMIPIGIGGTLSLGAAASLALEPFPDIAGLATAVLGFVEALVAAIVGTLAVGSGVHSTLPLGVAAVVLSGAMILLRRNL